MNRCSNCRWWGRVYHGACDRVDSEDGTVTTLSQTRIGLQFEVQATADDDQGLTARLLTGPNFGCVLHSLKREEPNG